MASLGAIRTESDVPHEKAHRDHASHVRVKIERPDTGKRPGGKTRRSEIFHGDKGSIEIRRNAFGANDLFYF